MDGAGQKAASDIVIHPVASAAELDRFIALPNRLNKNDPNYVAPLMYERREAFSAKTNPFFAHAEVQFWLAVRDGRDVGRISAQIDQLAPETSDLPTGHFGLIAAEDDPAIFAALFATAEDWLKARGKRRALGPFNLSINEEVGVLIDGFDTPPMLMMGHDPRYAGARVEEQGYAKAMDVFAYKSLSSDPFSPRVVKFVERPLPSNVRVRQLNMKRYDDEVNTLTEILNDAWRGNWGFTPTTEAETRQLAKSLKSVVDPRLTWFGEIDGETAGIVVFIPNVNEAIADLDGKLLPFGWAKLLWRLKVKGVKTARVPLMGVRQKFHRMHAGMLLPFYMINAAHQEAKAMGITTYESSWILETNAPMRGVLEGLAARIYKTYRIYEKTIA
ncbi:MAG: dATP pyrophosphohydrolase [Caulobacterales bacterium]